jgi:malate dehydrogenase
MENINNTKVAIVGAGAVGATAGYNLAMMGICSEIVLYDINIDIAIGKAIDISQATAYAKKRTKVIGAKDPSQLDNCDIVIITAGVPRKDGMTREDLLMINTKIMQDVVQKVMQYSPNAIIVCVSNPLDVMSYVVHKLTNWSRNRIIGMAGALDSARMSYEIDKVTNFGGAKINAMVIGDHGENMIPATTLSTIGSLPLDTLVTQEDMKQIIQNTKNGGAKIVKHLGTSAYYAPAMAIAAMVEAILTDSKTIFPSSALLDGEYGYSNVSIGVPVVLGKNGIEKIIEIELNDNLKESFDISVKTIKDSIKILEDKQFI